MHLYGVISACILRVTPIYTLLWSDTSVYPIGMIQACTLYGVTLAGTFQSDTNIHLIMGDISIHFIWAMQARFLYWVISACITRNNTNLIVERRQHAFCWSDTGMHFRMGWYQRAFIEWHQNTPYYGVTSAYTLVECCGCAFWVGWHQRTFLEWYQHTPEYGVGPACILLEWYRHASHVG